MKRIFDFLIGLFCLIILSPLFLIIAVCLLIDDGAPVFFKQDRVGKDNELFKIYKFRTMKKGFGDVATADVKNLEEHTTSFGRLLRKTSLDELPQFINLVNGTMSLVGPRPLIPSEKEIRALREKYNVYSVLPGITGWAQVNGRDDVPNSKKALLDKEYVDKQSISFDIKILIKTVKMVITREGNVG